MASITTQLFGQQQEANGDDEEQLLKLFWNRAELKKELDKLRHDSLLAAEQLKQQEAIALRLQQKLEQLEVQLADPEHANSVVAYFHLLGVWNICRSRLLSLSHELARVVQEQRYREHVAQFRRALNESLSGVQQQLKEVTQEGELLSEKIRFLREQRSAKKGFWNFLRRRKLTQEIRSLRMDRRAITMRLGELTEELQARSGKQPPELDGIDATAKRVINLQVIATAQELYLHFSENQVAQLAREVSIRALNDMKFGSRRDCRALCSYIEERLSTLTGDPNFKLRVKQRVTYLQSIVEYRQDADTVPIATTLGAIQLFTASGKPAGTESVNVLGDEYWDVFAALLT